MQTLNQMPPVGSDSVSDNFRHFFEALEDMIVVGTASGEVLYINKVITEKLGYTLEEVQKIGLLGLNPINRRSEAETNFAEMLQGKMAYCPLPLQAKDGHLIPAETRIAFGKWDGRDCVFGIMKDLSIQNAALQRFETIFNSNPLPMAISKVSDHKFMEINQAFLDTIKYSKEEVIGHTSQELDLFIKPEEQLALAQELTQTGHIRNRTLTLKTKSGEVLTGLFSGEIIDVQDDKAFLTTMINITENIKVKKILAEKDIQLSDLLISIPDIVFFKDLDGKYLGCNPQFAKLIKHEQTDIIGKTDYDFYNKEKADLNRANDQIVMDNNLPRHTEEWIVNPDGTRKLVDTLKAPLYDSNNRVIGLLGVSRDITERKNSENELKKLNEMMIGRELKMVEMKARIAELEKQLNSSNHN